MKKFLYYLGSVIGAICMMVSMQEQLLGWMITGILVFVFCYKRI